MTDHFQDFLSEFYWVRFRERKRIEIMVRWGSPWWGAWLLNPVYENLGYLI